MWAVALLTVAAVILWQTAGFISVWLIRPDLAPETRDALINVWLWPAGFGATFIWHLVKIRREKARQERISAKVAAGEYDGDWARATLHWRG